MPVGTGTGTTLEWYRYQDNVVPIPLLPTALIFGILTLLSSNLNTESIGTLIND